MSPGDPELSIVVPIYNEAGNIPAFLARTLPYRLGLSQPRPAHAYEAEHAVGRTTLSFLIALLLAVGAIWFQYLGLWNDNDMELAESWMFSGALYFITTIYLLRYVFSPRVMTQDKLFGAAAAYLMLGVLWAYVYAIVGYFYPESYMIVGQPGRLVYADALYLSITVLTSTGFGDVTPLTRQARGVCMVEQITGALFVAILIARLAGVYPPRESYSVDDMRQ